MRDQGASLRSQADLLLNRAEAAPWEGFAADAMRARVRAQVGALRHTADLSDDAAVALEQHADEVDRLKALIAAIEHKAMALVTAAQGPAGRAGRQRAPRPARRAARPVRATAAGPPRLAPRRPPGPVMSIDQEPEILEVHGGSAGVAASYAAARALADVFDHSR